MKPTFILLFVNRSINTLLSLLSNRYLKKEKQYGAWSIAIIIKDQVIRYFNSLSIFLTRSMRNVFPLNVYFFLTNGKVSMLIILPTILFINERKILKIQTGCRTKTKGTSYISNENKKLKDAKTN